MSGDREAILGRIVAALEELPEKEPYPEWETSLAVSASRPLIGDRWSVFSERLTAVHGLPLETPEELGSYLKAFGFTNGFCDPELVPILESWLGPETRLETRFDRERMDTYQFGITRARAAIAETGSVVMTDNGTASRLGALAPWVHIACLRREDIFRDTAEAVAALDDDPNILWITGPSKTADVEGILIEGVHGPGIQICLLLP